MSDGGACPRTTAVLEHGLGERLHIGAQVYASIGGAALVDLALSEVRVRDTLDASYANLQLRR